MKPESQLDIDSIVQQMIEQQKQIELLTQKVERLSNTLKTQQNTINRLNNNQRNFSESMI